MNTSVQENKNYESSVLKVGAIPEFLQINELNDIFTALTEVNLKQSIV